MTSACTGHAEITLHKCLQAAQDCQSGLGSLRRGDWSGKAVGGCHFRDLPVQFFPGKYMEIWFPIILGEICLSGEAGGGMNRPPAISRSTTTSSPSRPSVPIPVLAPLPAPLRLPRPLASSPQPPRSRNTEKHFFGAQLARGTKSSTEESMISFTCCKRIPQGGWKLLQFPLKYILFSVEASFSGKLFEYWLNWIAIFPLQTNLPRHSFCHMQTHCPTLDFTK